MATSEIIRINNTIKHLCENKGVTAQDIANLLNRPLPHIEMFFRGEKIFHWLQLEKIAEYLNISVDEFFNDRS